MAFERDYPRDGIIVRLEIRVGDDAVGQNMFINKSMLLMPANKDAVRKKAKEMIVTLAEEAMKKIDEEFDML